MKRFKKAILGCLIVSTPALGDDFRLDDCVAIKDGFYKGRVGIIIDKISNHLVFDAYTDGIRAYKLDLVRFKLNVTERSITKVNLTKDKCEGVINVD